MKTKIAPTASTRGERSDRSVHRATLLLELWISNYHLKERCFDNNDVYPVSVSHKHTFAPDERD
jgi:hypothetical protein